MKKVIIVAASVVLYAIIDVSCFLIYFVKPYSGWSLVTALLLTAYTLFAMGYIYKKTAFPWWAAWLCIVPCGTVLMITILALLQPLAPSAPFYGATALLFIFLGSAVQYVIWMAAAAIARCLFLYRHRKK